MYLMNPYDEVLHEILNNGCSRTNKRTGINTLSVFGMMKRFDLSSDYFPIITRRKVWPKSIFAELLWFLSGSTNNKDLQELGSNIWTPWVDPAFEEKHGYAAGLLGPVYGFQLRHFGGYYGNGIGGVSGSPRAFIEVGETTPWNESNPERFNGYGAGGFDQLKWVIERIKEDHSCRRTLWSLWNPNDIDKSRLPPCHWAFQLMVDDDRKLTGMLMMRSVDAPIGLPANIQFYAALTKMIAQQTNCIAHELVWVGGDVHIYENQIEAVGEYLRLPIIDSPKVEIKKAENICSYTPENFVVTEFTSGPKLNIPVAV